LACLAAWACDDAGGSPETQEAMPDAVAGEPDMAPAVQPGDAALPAPDGTVDGEVLPPDAAALVACERDADCGELAWCDADGACQPEVPVPFVELLGDGVTRAGAASFDITPGALERWVDHAGPDCPENRPGRFDGRLDIPTPADPCADAFEDDDGDGRFDAVWVGGDGLDRPALHVDNENPPQGRVLVLARDETLYVLVTLDVHAVDAARIRTFVRRLRRRLGVPAGSIAVHATGVRSGPDAVGLSGPSLARSPAFDALNNRLAGAGGLLEELPATSGTDERWWDEVVRRCTAAARQAGAQLVPVEVRSGTIALPVDADPDFEGAVVVDDADADEVRNDRHDLRAWHARTRLLSRDTHLPAHRDRTLRSLVLQSIIGGEPVAFLFTWGAAPAATPLERPSLSGDFAGVARGLLEAAHPGAVAVWLAGAAGDTVLAGRGARVPRVDERGRLLGPNGVVVATVEEAADAERPAVALGRLVAAHALTAVDGASPAPAELEISGRFAWVPLTNPRFGLAARLGIMAPLGAWISRRAATNAWSSGETTPACGGLGCVRYRVDRIDLGGVTLLALPGAPDDAYVRGRDPGSLDFGDERNLRDLDGDGLADGEDPEIRAQTRGHGREAMVSVSGPANPQLFDAVRGLGGERVWLLGRTNGGVGSLRGARAHVNVFEGQLAPLSEFVSAPVNAAVAACPIWPCAGETTLGALAEGAIDAQPGVLADLEGAHELWLRDVDFEEGEVVEHWWLADEEDVLRVGGQGPLVLGPGNRVHAPEVNFVAAGVEPGDHLVIDGEDLPSYQIGGVVPVVLRDHPNSGGAWHAASPEGGDLVYNTACELLFDGPCPHGRPSDADPNQSLPRAP